MTSSTRPPISADDRARLLEAFFDHTNLHIAYLDRELRFIRVNRAYASADGLAPEDFVGKGHFELYPNAENEAIFRRVLETGEPHHERAKAFVYVHAEERGVTYWDWSLVPVPDDEGEVSGLVLSLLDVTTRERSLRGLRESEQKFHALFEESPDAIFVIDAETLIPFEANESAIRFFGHALDTFMSRPVSTLDALRSHAELEDVAARVFRDGRDLHETTVRLASGELREVEVIARPVRLNSRDGIQVVVRDLTQERSARQQVERSLAEKEVLLREVHHRVKNNLQLVSSLLYLQQSQLDDAAGRRAFEEARRRILAMALIHQRLYRSGDFANLDLHAYLQELAEQIALAHDHASQSVALHVEVARVAVPVDVAVPCGLLVNELVSNAFAHAFEGRSSGSVRVFGSARGRTLELEISDDGIGLPNVPERVQGSTLGLRMVHALVQQLGATLEVDVDGGTRFRVTVPLDRS
ncbi:MAG: PAS domain S-box protein [Myxococcales bacterium]|nr:PAS domain S-box protein [Myxococcales bacterium]